MKSWVRSSPFRADALTDRVVLATGGGSGIGFEVCRQLGLHGAKVCIMGRRENFLKDACEKFRSQGIACTHYAGDVRKPQDCAAAVAHCVAEFGALNVLINGAAGMFPATIGESMTPNGFKTVLDIDVLGTYTMSCAALGALKAPENEGKALVLNITVPRHFLEGRNWYTAHMQAAKSAITTLSHSMAKEWAEYGIRVCNVGPGAIADTPGADMKLGKERRDGMSRQELNKDGIPKNKRIPLGRGGTSFEIGMACLYLCTAEYVTAETICVDGGWWLGNEPPPVPRAKLNAVSRANESKSRALKAKM